MLLHRKGKLTIAKSKSSRLSYSEVVSLPLESILSDPWVEACAGGLLVPEGLYSPVAKYFGICLKIRRKLSSKK